MTPRYPDPDPDAIEVCNEPGQEASPHHLKQLAARHSKSLGRQANHTGQHLHHPNLHHDYSYAYYEPGAAMRHSNVPRPEKGAATASGGGAGGHVVTVAMSPASSDPPPPNSIRALLSKGKKNKQLVSPATLQSYQTRYHKLASSAKAGQSENFYEEINAAALQGAPPATSGAPWAPSRRAPSTRPSWRRSCGECRTDTTRSSAN